MRHLLDQRTLARLIPYQWDNNTFVDIVEVTNTTDADGMPLTAIVSKGSYLCDLQPIIDDRDRITIQIGGENVTPTFRAYIEIAATAIPGDYITPDSGITKYEVLATFEFDDHLEIDLRRRT